MERYAEVFKRILGLTGLMQEAVDSLVSCFEESRFDNFAIINGDIMNAVDSIEKSLKPVINRFEKNKIQLYTYEFKNALVQLNLDLAIGNYDGLNSVLNEEIGPVYRNWKKEIDKILKPVLLN